MLSWVLKPAGIAIQLLSRRFAAASSVLYPQGAFCPQASSNDKASHTQTWFFMALEHRFSQVSSLSSRKPWPQAQAHVRPYFLSLGVGYFAIV
jgi:hypothetical protein